MNLPADTAESYKRQEARPEQGKLGQDRRPPELPMGGQEPLHKARKLGRIAGGETEEGSKSCRCST